MEEGHKGEKKWDNCNSIINKIYFKKDITAYTHTGKTEDRNKETVRTTKPVEEAGPGLQVGICGLATAWVHDRPGEMYLHAAALFLG